MGAFLAGIAGVVGAQTLGADLSLGWSILLLALIVLVVGGAGLIQGALLGGMIIGIIDSFGKALLPYFANFFMYVVMIVVLMIKPTGILTRRG